MRRGEVATPVSSHGSRTQPAMLSSLLAFTLCTPTSSEGGRVGSLSNMCNRSFLLKRLLIRPNPYDTKATPFKEPRCRDCVFWSNELSYETWRSGNPCQFARLANTASDAVKPPRHPKGTPWHRRTLARSVDTNHTPGTCPSKSNGRRDPRTAQAKSAYADDDRAKPGSQ